MNQQKISVWRWLLVIPLAASILVALFGCVYIYNGLAAARWDKTEGTIVESGFPLKYEFTADGKSHTGSVVSHSFVTPSEEQLKQLYPVGKKVAVYYAPSEGTYLSVLEPGFHFDSILLTVLALVFAFLWWKGMRPERKKQQANEASNPPAAE